MKKFSKPKPGSLLLNSAYWKKVGEDRHPWTFDFISVHRTSEGKYTLCSPLCLVTEEGRPSWESKKFETKFEAVEFASKTAKENNIFVVDCSKQ